MLDSTHAKTSPAARDSHELRPARALLTPTWIGALALLVANDHWLKGSGVLPELMTGKLSDFAGMLVAPVLLASLLGVRSRKALAACHVAVALVFAGIQLSTGFAALWSGLMGVLGHPWAITCDPTDLIALPFLLLSWKLLVPSMDPELPAMVPVQRTAVAGLSVFGLWSTVATSQVEPGIDPNDVWYEDVRGNVFINNANDFDIALHIRLLRGDLELDCDKISADPGRLLDEDAFAEAAHWQLPARTNVGIEFPTTRTCGAAWVAGEGIAPTIVFVDNLGLAPSIWQPGQSFDPSSLGTAGLAIAFDDDGSEWLGNEELLHTPRTDAPEQPHSCEVPSGELRFDWPLSVPKRDVRVLGVDAGVDGCFELEVQELISVADNEVADHGEPYGFYLCAPAAAVPFVEGDVLRFDEVYGTQGDRELAVLSLDPVSLEPALSEAGSLLRRVRYLRGGHDPALIGPAINRNLVAVPGVGCPFEVAEDECATVARHVNLAVAGGQNYLQPGEPVAFADDPGEGAVLRTAVLGYSREHAVIDLACAEGSLRLDYDIDFAVVEEPLI